MEISSIICWGRPFSVKGIHRQYMLMLLIKAGRSWAMFTLQALLFSYDFLQSLDLAMVHIFKCVKWPVLLMNLCMSPLLICCWILNPLKQCLDCCDSYSWSETISGNCYYTEYDFCNSGQFHMWCRHPIHDQYPTRVWTARSELMWLLKMDDRSEGVFQWWVSEVKDLINIWGDVSENTPAGSHWCYWWSWWISELLFCTNSSV